jgi:hypothetical protein
VGKRLFIFYDFNPTFRMPLGGSGGDGGAAAQEKARQAAIDSGMGRISQLYSKYDDNFYQQRGKDYQAFATPQMMSQFRTTKNNLAYALARNGILNSGAAVKENANLDNTLDQNTSTIANAAQDQENQLRQQVQGSRNNLTQQLIASSDPSSVSINANAATAGLNAPGAFQPLGNMFSDFANTYLANINARAYNPQTASIWSQLGF